jgi:hypothetical protein
MTDIMAQEAFRTTLAEILGTAATAEKSRVYEFGGEPDSDSVAAEVVDKFPEVEWEFTTNDNGVPVRRLVVKGEWLVDLTVSEIAATASKGDAVVSGGPKKHAPGRPDRAYNCVGHTVACRCMGDQH